jgi:hypothetical protein
MRGWGGELRDARGITRSVGYENCADRAGHGSAGGEPLEWVSAAPQGIQARDVDLHRSGSGEVISRLR